LREHLTTNARSGNTLEKLEEVLDVARARVARAQHGDDAGLAEPVWVRVPPHLFARLLYANPVCFLTTRDRIGAGDARADAPADAPASAPAEGPASALAQGGADAGDADAGDASGTGAIAVAEIRQVARLSRLHSRVAERSTLRAGLQVSKPLRIRARPA